MILRMIGIEAMPATSGSSLPRCGFRNSTGYNTGVCQAIARRQKKKKKKKKKVPRQNSGRACDSPLI